MASNLVVNVTEFKAKCLSLISEVEAGRTSITVTRRGKAVAVLGPVKSKGFKTSRDSWKGKAEIIGDIVNTDWSDRWDMYNGRSEPK